MMRFATSLPIDEALTFFNTMELPGWRGEIATKIVKEIAERLSFLKRPDLFFAGDHWRDDPAFWTGKNDRTPATNDPNAPSLGGRAPSKKITC